MNQKTLNCKYIYDSITENENVYTLQKKNNSTQTINGYKLELKDNQVQFNYNSNTKIFESKTYYSINQNSFTLYYVFVNVEIIKPENNNISFYQISSDKTRNDDTFTFPANSELVDAINYAYITSSVIANGLNLNFKIGGFDQSDNLVDISQCIINMSFKSYPII